MTKDALKSLSSDSRVQLGFVVVLVGFIVSGVWWAATIDSKLANIERKVERVVDDHEQRIRSLEHARVKP